VLDLAGRNADVESFGIHMRNFIDFLFGGDGDAIADKYFDDRNHWLNLLPRKSKPESLKTVPARVGAEIGHMSSRRARVKDKNWPYIQLWFDLAPFIRTSVDNVPDGYVSDEFRESVRAVLPDNDGGGWTLPTTIAALVGATEAPAVPFNWVTATSMMPKGLNWFTSRLRIRGRSRRGSRGRCRGHPLTRGRFSHRRTVSASPQNRFGVGTDSFAGHHLRCDAYPPEFAIHFGSKDACRHIDRNDPTRNGSERSVREVQWRRPTFSESLANSFAGLGSAIEHRRQLDDFLQRNQLGACQSHACQFTHRRSPFHSISATPQPPSSQPHRSRSGARAKPHRVQNGFGSQVAARIPEALVFRPSGVRVTSQA
jgi:hypothetical protein